MSNSVVYFMLRCWGFVVKNFNLQRIQPRSQGLPSCQGKTLVGAWSRDL
jgi:hypothetical protein